MITDFLKTQRDKNDLRVALEVLREFKECESGAEWLRVSNEYDRNRDSGATPDAGHAKQNG